MNIKTADRLLELRKKNNFSQEQLAEKIGVSRQAVSKWERAEASPDIDNLILLSKLYNMTLDQLINGDELSSLDNLSTKDVSEESLDHKDNLSSNSNDISKQTNALPKKEATDKPLNENEEPNFRQDFQKSDSAHCVMKDSSTSPHKHKKKKLVFRPTNMPYPVIVTFVYLILGFAFNWWHPGWILFLTIPVFYCCFIEVDYDEDQLP